MRSLLKSHVAAGLVFGPTLLAAPSVFAQTTPIVAVAPNATHPTTPLDVSCTAFRTGGASPTQGSPAASTGIPNPTVGPSSITLGNLAVATIYNWYSVQGSPYNSKMTIDIPGGITGPGTYQLKVMQSGSAGK